MERSRVAIIGAGAAGLSAAVALKERQLHDVTVFEREAHVGGKCKSFEYDDRVYDLGANLTTPRYTWIRRTAETLGMTRRTIEARRIVHVRDEDIESLRDANVLQRLVVRGGASVYTQVRHLSRIDRIGYAQSRAGVSQPFGEWLRRHGLGRFRELFEVLFIAYGYGQMLDLPAAYALKFFDPIHLEAAVDVVLGAEAPDTMDFVEGFQELWERVDERFDLQTRRGSVIEEVRRSPTGVTVRGSGPGGRFEEHFDKLIVACPLDAALDFLDASREERRLFSQVRFNDYYVTIARMQGAPDISTYVYPYARRFTPGQPTVFYPPVPGDDGLFVFYAYGGPGIDTAVVRQNIELLTRSPEIDGRIDEFLHTEHWRYFPHVTSEVMRAGFYEDVEAMQGRFHTYYAGEALSFTLVELVAEYSRALVAEHF